MNIRILKCSDKVVWICPKCKNKLIVFYTDVELIKPLDRCKFCGTKLKLPVMRRK